MADEMDAGHYRRLARRCLDGSVVPFLGAGVNMVGRTSEDIFRRGGSVLPSGTELARYLAAETEYPYQDTSNDLLRVSQFFDLELGTQALYDSLHGIFDADYPPTPIHRMLAALPEMIRARPGEGRRFYPLYITTNYDDALERALQDAGEEYDLVTYIADGPDRGRFQHTPPNGEPVTIAIPNTYPELKCDSRPVVAKIHGTVHRHELDSRNESFVITENHYIAYLSRSDILKLIPVNIAARMKKCHFLFLGYSLKDWNLRVILHRIWGEDGLGFRSWAVQPRPDLIEERSWRGRGVELLDITLERYVEELISALSEAAATGE